VGNDLTHNAKALGVKAGSPNTLGMTTTNPTTGDSEQWFINSATQARYTSMNAKGDIETFQHGSTPREFVYRDPKGKTFSMSTGTDVAADLVKYDGEQFEVRGFRTIASEPTRATNEALIQLKEIIANTNEATRDVWRAQLATMGELGQTLIGALFPPKGAADAVADVLTKE
jgi:hypothetical protein